MSTSKTYQQSLADASSETRPPMLERGSYIPWASRFQRYINRNRENRKWLNKALDEGPYQFQLFIPSDSIIPKLQTAEDLQGGALLHYDAEIEVMNLILHSIPNDIYNSMDGCTSAKDMWKRVKRLMMGTIHNKVDRETRFTNEFDQFVAEPGESLVSVYNRFAQLMNDLEQNDMHFPIQFEKLVNTSRAKKLEKSYDLLALVAHTGSSSRNTSSYYVTHPTYMVDYDDEYQQDDIQTNSEDPLTSAMNSGNAGRNNRHAYVQEEVVEGSNETGNDEARVILTDEQNDLLFANALRMEEIEDLSANICLVARIQPTNHSSDVGPSYDSSFTIDYQQINALYKDFVPQKELSAEQKYFPSSFIPSDKNSKATNSIPTSMPSESPLIIELDKMRSCFQKLSELIQKNCKRASIFYTSLEEVQLNDFCQDQVKPIVNELQFYFEYFRTLFQRDIKEMKDVFESTKSELCELQKQNDFLKDQLLEVSLKHQVELRVLLNHECVDNFLHAEIEQIKRKSIEIQEGLQARIKILEKDVQRCEKQSVDFELMLQHEKEKHKWDSTLQNNNTKSLDFSWILKMEKLEYENVSLDFQGQFLIKECDNVKVEYQKLFDSIKKTRSQIQKDIDQLIVHVPEKTYAYGAIHAENQNLLFIIFELKTRLKNVKKAPGMYKVVTPQESQTHNTKSGLSSTRMNAASSVRRSMNRDSHDKNSVLDNSKNSAKKVAVYVRKNKQTDNTITNVISNKENVIDIDVANASLNMYSNARRTLSTKSKTLISLDTTYVILKTRFSKKLAQSKTLDTPSIVSKPKIDEGSASKDKNKVVQIVLWIVDSGCSKYMTGDRSMLRNFIKKFMGTVHFGNDNFAGITGYGDYIHGNITIFHVYYVEGLRHNLFSVGQFCDGDLEVAFRSKTCYMQNLEGDDLLTGGRKSNIYTISISDMAVSSPVCRMSKATSTKSWLWHHRLSHLNFGTTNDLTRLDLVNGLPKFKYEMDHLCSACERGKSKKVSHPPKLVSSDNSRLELLHMDLCGPMRVTLINGKKHHATFSTACTPQQNGVVERCNRTLVEAAQTMLIFSRLPVFLWAEAVATTCFTQNRSIIHTRYNKTPYELLCSRKSNVEYFHVFGSLCYPTNDRDDLGKIKPKANIGVFIEHEAPPIETTYDEQTSPISLTEADELHQEDSANFDGNSQQEEDIDFKESFAPVACFEKHGLDERVSMSTPMATERLDTDLQGTPTNQMTYRRMIGWLMYLTASRPNIAYATFVYARYQARPTVKHLKEVKWIFRYIRQCYNKGLWYSKDSGFELIAYSDANHAGCKDDCKSTPGGFQFLGGKLVSWSSKKQDCTAMSTAEAEYVSLYACCAQVIWMQYQLADLFTKALPKEFFEYLVHRIVIIMAHQQLVAEVHPNELCPTNKRYDLMDANKKIDLEHVQSLSKSKILTNIIKSHPLRFNIAASSSVPWIYMVQFWHTLKEDGSKYKLKFMLDRKELSLTLDEFRTIFHLPQATDNNHDSFVLPPSFSDMIQFYKNHLGFTMELKTPSSFKTTGLLRAAMGKNSLFFFHSTSSIPYPRFTKIIIGHYITNFPKISRRAQDKMYAKVFGIDVPLIQSQPIESTQGTHRTPSALRSTRLTPPAPVVTVDKADKLILQDILQIEKIVEGQENVVDDSSIPRNDEHNIPDTRLNPKSDKESPKVEFTNVVIHVNVYDEEEKEDEITDEARFMPQNSFGTLANNLHDAMAKSLPVMVDKHVKEQVEQQVPEHVRNQVLVYVAEGLILKRQKNKEEIEKMIVKAILQARGNIQAQISSQIQQAIVNINPSQVDASVKSYLSGHILHVRPAQPQTNSVPEQQYQLYLTMKDDPQLQQQDIAIWLALQMKFERLQIPQTTCKTPVVRPRDQDDPHDDAHPEGENSAKQQKTSEYEADVSGESSSRKDNEQEQGPSTSTKLKKIADKMLRQRCTSGDEHQYHIDQMKNFLKSNIVWESRKEILVSPHLRKTTSFVLSCQRDS
uniref:Integrase, catalytic region, zinc finger, CCHC-type, peptidase aspartic, catalytic n=1 Tax=Tanacetum cinerariifolium TaxID=118510 RepID=A0A6L2P5G2_TANCI|nr:integrase, catalytic region, zinc finger, CCHC-type, peptidase aspartic, catalytic [Tanacetum cinerariifolium]